ncbi:MAG: leucine-rich repeat domain-containing protein [Mycoplasmataceae bacterium]|nr:leucine-rich repeat domain-containing protein [Mycoplasmataceae bacterium]
MLARAKQIFILFISVIFSCLVFTAKNNTNQINQHLSSLHSTTIEKTFSFDQTQLKNWNITNGTINFLITKEPTNDSFGEVTLNSINDAFSFVAKDLVIPDYVIYQGENYLITNMANFIFADCKSINGSLSLGQNLTHISKGAFGGTNISGVITIPPNVKSIDSLAFNALNMVAEYHLTPINPIEFPKSSFLPFGTKFSDIYVPKKLVDIYKQNINLMDYAILPFTEIESNNFFITRDQKLENGIVYINSSTKSTDLKNIYHFKNNGKNNLALNIQCIPQNASKLQTRWLSITQANNDGIIDFNVNPYYYTLYPETYVFIIKFSLIDNPHVYITDAITFSFLDQEIQKQILPYKINVYVDDSQWKSTKQNQMQLNILKNEPTIIHFTAIATQFGELNWPAQNNFLDFKIDSKLISKITINNDIRCWIIDNSVKNGSYNNSLLIKWNNQLTEQYLFTIKVTHISNAIPWNIIIPAIIAPAFLILTLTLTFLFFRKNKYHLVKKEIKHITK